MIGYILTIDQKDSIQGVEFVPYQSFNCVQDIDGVWFTFLSEDQKVLILDTQWNWVLTLLEGEYIPTPTPPGPPTKK
jgi:hypothetical protein